MKLFFAICIFWSATLSLATAGSYQMRGLALWFGWAPTMFFAAIFAIRALYRLSQHAAMLKAIGMEPGANFEHSEGGTGIALLPGAKVVALRDGGHWKTYPFSEVRGWEARVDSAAPMVVLSATHAAASLGAELQEKRRARLNTGFFVSVRDIDHAQWRVAMKSKATRSRWMEILQQQINERHEGGVAASA